MKSCGSEALSKRFIASSEIERDREKRGSPFFFFYRTKSTEERVLEVCDTEKKKINKIKCGVFALLALSGIKLTP